MTLSPALLIPAIHAPRIPLRREMPGQLRAGELNLRDCSARQRSPVRSLGQGEYTPVELRLLERPIPCAPKIMSDLGFAHADPTAQGANGLFGVARLGAGPEQI